MPHDSIVVRGAREHNLKNIDVDDPARQARRDHRPLRLRQVVAGLRHDLRRGPAAVCRVAVGLRAAVPGPDGEARRRLHRGPLAGDLDRPEGRVAATRARPSARRRRSTTTCACSTRAPAARIARTAAGRSSARPCSRSSTRILDLPPGKRLMVLAPIITDRKGEHHRSSRTRARPASCACASTARSATSKSRSRSTAQDAHDRSRRRPPVIERGARATRPRPLAGSRDSVETALKLGSGIIERAAAG